MNIEDSMALKSEACHLKLKMCLLYKKLTALSDISAEEFLNTKLHHAKRALSAVTMSDQIQYMMILTERFLIDVHESKLFGKSLNTNSDYWHLQMKLQLMHF